MALKRTGTQHKLPFVGFQATKEIKELVALNSVAMQASHSEILRKIVLEGLQKEAKQCRSIITMDLQQKWTKITIVDLANASPAMKESKFNNFVIDMEGDLQKQGVSKANIIQIISNLKMQ